MYEWIHDDITWCMDECSHTECRRNLANRITKDGLCSMAFFANTETCPLYNNNKKEDDTSK